jgi:hypothetical protein
VLPVPAAMAPDQAADYVVGVRLTFPDADDPEDALRLALPIARDDTFRQRRRVMQDWQRRHIQKWAQAGDTVSEYDVKQALAELDELIHAYNEYACGKHDKRRKETAITFGLLGIGAAGLLADTAAGGMLGLTAASLGGLITPGVMKIGGFGAASFLQVKRHQLGASEPDAAARIPVVGAIFHQVEQAKLRDSRWWRKLNR